MSLPKFETQGSLFERVGLLAGKLFSDQDRYKLFATKIWPLLAKSREELAACYVLDNGRPGVEPVILLGVLIFQFLERVPDRQAAELVKYHLGWKLALNLDLNFQGIHHTTLSYFRDRLLAEGKADLAMRIISEGLEAAGVDCLRLLQWLAPLPIELRECKAVVLLREVFAQQYVVEESGRIEPVKVHATGVVQNPHDPEAEWSAKGRGKHKKEWVGYKVQLAETVPQQEGQIGFITSVVTQRASESDDPGLELTLEKQKQMALERPSETYVDGAYISANAITQAREEGWELMGPAQPSPAPPKQPELYRIEAFDVNIEQRKAVCPQAKISTECSKLTERDSGKVTYRFEFGRQCRNCVVKHLCVPEGQPHRMIRVGALHAALQQRRREQQTPEFKLRMQQRNGIEGTISELVRGHGLRRARYKGSAKVDLQNQLIAAACNIKRWLRRISLGASQPAPQAHLAPRQLLRSPFKEFSSILRRLSARLRLFGLLSLSSA